MNFEKSSYYDIEICEWEWKRRNEFGRDEHSTGRGLRVGLIRTHLFLAVPFSLVSGSIRGRRQVRQHEKYRNEEGAGEAPFAQRSNSEHGTTRARFGPFVDANMSFLIWPSCLL